MGWSESFRPPARETRFDINDDSRSCPCESLITPTSAVARTPVVPPTVDLTSEIRWFFDGRLPLDVENWFAADGALEETRCDMYRLDDPVGQGVKRRGRSILELKQRLRPSEVWSLGFGIAGNIESWKRWSPADELVALGAASIWVEVDKHIVKRRFDPDGLAIALSESNRAMVDEGCDAEIASLLIDGRSAWSFAFAAFGPIDGHRRSLEAGWRTLVADHPRPRQLRLEGSNSCGYPEWISRALRDAH